MGSVLKIELERIRRSKMLYVAILLEIAIIAYDLIIIVLPGLYETLPDTLAIYEISPIKINVLQGAYTYWISMNQSAPREMLYISLPMIVALPYGMSLYLDEKRAFVNNIAVRTKKSYYYISKIIGLFLSGGILAVLPLLMSFLCNICLLPLENVVASTGNYMIANTLILGDLFFINPILYIIIYMLWTFLIYGILNTMCFIGTYLFDNRFIVILCPFIIYFCSYIVANIVPGITAFPWLYGQMNRLKVSDLPYAIIEIVIYLAVLIIACVIKSSKKRDVLA